MKKVLITGATGFIGKALTKSMLSNGKSVIAVGTNIKRLDELISYGNLQLIEADMHSYSNLHEKLINETIDVFYHFAWQGVFGSAFKDYSLQLSNAKCACDALIAAKALGCEKFVFAGSINQFEIEKFLKEDTIEPRFTCVYATCKLAADMICKTLAYNYGINYNAGLIAMTYGEGNKSEVLPNVIIKSLIDNKQPKLVSGNNKYDLIYIDDVVNAFILIGEKGVNQKSYYVGNRNIRTFKEVVTDIRNIVNPDIELVFGEYQDSLDMDYSLIDLDKLYIDTGFKCKADFRDSILRTTEWIKNNYNPSK